MPSRRRSQKKVSNLLASICELDWELIHFQLVRNFFFQLNWSIGLPNWWGYEWSMHCSLIIEKHSKREERDRKSHPRTLNWVESKRKWQSWLNIAKQNGGGLFPDKKPATTCKTGWIRIQTESQSIPLKNWFFGNECSSYCCHLRRAFILECHCWLCLPVCQVTIVRTCSLKGLEFNGFMVAMLAPVPAAHDLDGSIQS